MTPKQTVLVYDLGGGTFDVTLVRLAPRRFESLAIEGDVRLGGKDWDDRIVDFVAGKFLSQFGQDPRANPHALAALSAAAERAKRTLEQTQSSQHHLHSRRPVVDGDANSGRNSNPSPRTC